MEEDAAEGEEPTGGRRGAKGGLLKAVEAEKAFLTRTIGFVRASGSSSGSLQSASRDPDRDGPVPPYYLYPRHSLRALCEGQTPRRVGRGLINAGNTCFFNSVLQTLSYTRPLQNYLLSGEHARACSARSDGMFCALCLFELHTREALSSNRSPVNPKAMLKHLKQLGGKSMQLGRQEDAHEFLLHFLDACHKAALQPATQRSAVPPLVQRTTLIHQLFGGYLRSTVVCQDCQHESNTFDPFLDLSLEVRTASTLEKALEGFTKSELLSGQNRWRCRQCERPVDVTKRFFLHTLPPLMMFQLKRFEFSQGSRGKIVKNVSFGTSVDLARFTSHPEKEAKYQLYAVIVHQGHTAKSGHYYAFVRHCSGTWYHFDDMQVRAVSEQQVLRTQAYLLFYEIAKLPPDLSGPPAVSGSADAAADAVDKSAPHGEANGFANGFVNGAASGAPNGVAHGAAASNGDAHRLPPVGGLPSATARPAGAGAAVSSKQPDRERAKAAPPNGGSEESSEDDDSAPLPSDPPQRRRPHSRHFRRLRLLRRGSKRRRISRETAESREREHPAEEEAKVPVLPQPPPVRRRPVVRMADLAAASLKADHRTQYGRAEVSAWEDDAPAEPSQAFLDAQRKLQPEPEHRDQLDTEYDVGKLKHKPRKAKPSFSGRSAFDKEQSRREKYNVARGRGRGRFGDEGHPGRGGRRRL